MRARQIAVAMMGLALAGTITGGTATGGAADAAPTERGRVDLDPPVFTNPTDITNPLFPIDDLDQVIQLGAEGDVALRHDVTTLADTKVIRWDGHDIETVVSQFVAYGDGEIIEVATDYFAQADNGSVWYLGEDVTNYENGRVLNHDGTWRAGRDGPGGLIMPADPQVGDAFRPENIPGLVFEEVTVIETGLTVDGPTGPVDGAILVQEKLLDGSVEDKYYAPGYGEFQAIVPESDELVTVAVAAPTDRSGRPEPRALDRLSDQSEVLFQAACRDCWSRVGAIADASHREVARLASTGVVPPLIQSELDEALDELDTALSDLSVRGVRQAAIHLGLAVLDVEMRFDEVPEIDRDRLEAWHRQLAVDRNAGDQAAVRSDRVIITAIKER